jgi:hypothetical protein
MAKRKKKKRKLKKIRDWLAISAWFRNSAGPIKDKKKDIKKQRRWKQRQNKDE